jgi:anti-anti-sigma factor
MEKTPEATVLHANGELDLSTLERLRVVAADAFAESRPLIVDLSGLVYIDGSGFRLLEDLDRIGKLQKQALVLAEPSPWVLKLIKLIHLDGTIPVFPTVSSAREWCRSASKSKGNGNSS